MTRQMRNCALLLCIVAAWFLAACNDTANPLQDLVGEWEVQSPVSGQRLQYALESDGRLKVTVPNEPQTTIYAELKPAGERKFSGSEVAYRNGVEAARASVEVEISADKQTLFITETFSGQTESNSAVLIRRGE